MTMNREAAGLGSWLPRDAPRPVSASLEDQGPLLDFQSFRWWQAQGERAADAGHAALTELLREIWREELTARERAVLRGVHLRKKSEAALARELGLHHSAVARLRGRGEEKLRGGLGYVMRYRTLVEQINEERLTE